MSKRDMLASENAKLKRSRQQASTSQSETETTNNEGLVSRSTVYNIRLSREELAALEQEANEEGLSVAEYLRQAAAMRPSMSILAKPQINMSISTSYSQYGTLVVWNESESAVTELQNVTVQGPMTLHMPHM